MSDITFSGDLLKNDAFMQRLGERFKDAGGVKAGKPVAYFEIGEERYIYKAYSCAIPMDMIKNDEDIIDIFEGLLVVTGGFAGVNQYKKSGEYIAIRTVELGTREFQIVGSDQKSERFVFYIRAVQV